MKRLITLAAPLLVLGLGAGGYATLHWAKPEPEKKQEAPRPLSVFVHTAHGEDVNLEVVTEGEVRARTTVDVTAQVAGRVVEVSSEFIEGGIVTPGDTLIAIERADYELALANARAQVAAAEVGVEQALADADVARKQLRDAANATPLARKEPQVTEARARLEAARATLKQAELDLERTRISLPFAGRVLETMVDVGQYVAPGSRLATAFATDVVDVRLPLNDSELASLGLPIGFVAEPGRGPVVTFSARLAGREHTWRGRLTRLDAAVDPDTRMLFAMAELTEPYSANVSDSGMPMAVGLYVQASIAGDRHDDALVIPRDALRAGDRVFVINDDDRLEIRNVRVLHSTTRTAVIGSGIHAGERVVVSSIRNAIQGMALAAMPNDSAAIADSGAHAAASIN